MTATILQGDALAVLAGLPAESVHCVVTSPPYYGLRDYGTATWEGGDPECDHIKGTAASAKSTLKNDGRINFGSNNYEKSIVVPYKSTCGKCGAVRIDNQIGLETTPAEYVDRLVAVFREVRRVLRPDGVCWLNIGDSYNGSGGTGGLTAKQTTNAGSFHNGTAKNVPGLKPKDLIGIPWRLAFALQDDGWWLRQDVIWHKPNPMPESVQDRCTKAHEYVFLLTKSARYYYDAQAIAEPSTYPDDDRKSRSAASQKRMPTAEIAGVRPGSATYPTRNRRSVWTIATEPTPYAHFATMPTALAETCILAGCPGGGTVLDPFAGSGTTLRVAVELGRNAIGIELNPEYADLADRLLNQTQPALFGI